MRVSLGVFVLISGLLATALGQVPPSQFGQVTLNKYSAKAGLGAVTFDHWLHRSKVTCRVCHVDIGFAMQAGASGIRATTNQQGFHCGACHDGKRSFDGKVVFAACSNTAPTQECARCHSTGGSARKYDYESFTVKFPKNAYGIDWEEAEAVGLIKPIEVILGLYHQEACAEDPGGFLHPHELPGSPTLSFRTRNTPSGTAANFAIRKFSPQRKKV